MLSHDDVIIAHDVRHVPMYFNSNTSSVVCKQIY